SCRWPRRLDWPIRHGSRDAPARWTLGPVTHCPATTPHQRQLEAMPQGLPARLDDVLRAAHGAPPLPPSRGFDHDPGPRGGAEVLVHDADLVIHQVHV